MTHAEEPRRESRPAMVLKGAQFWMENGEPYFQYVIDPASIVGPRKATEADSEQHPEAWAGFVATLRTSGHDATYGAGTLTADASGVAAHESIPAEPERAPRIIKRRRTVTAAAKHPRQHRGRSK